MLRGFCVAALVLACSAPAAEARVTVSAVKDPVRQIQAGKRLRVAYSVRNAGRSTAKPSRSRVALVRGRRVITLTNGRVPGGAARKAKALAVRTVVPATTTAGAYRLRVCIRTRCRQSRRSVKVTAPPTPPAPSAPAPPVPVPVPAPVPPDTTAPETPTLTASGFTSAAKTGSTLHYRAGGNGKFTVTATTDPDVARVQFSTLGQGWIGGGSDATPPFSATYSFSLLSAAPAAPLTAVAFDAAGNASEAARLSVAGDGAPPAITLTCEPDDCTGEVSLNAVDAVSGVARILYSLDGSAPTTPYTTPFLALTGMPLRARAVDRVGNAGPELARDIGPPTAHFGITFGTENVNAAGDDETRTAWIRPGVAGSVRVTALEFEDFSVPDSFTWPQLGPGWTVEPDFDTAVYSFTAGAAPLLTVTVHATTDRGPRESFFRIRHDGTPPAPVTIACACDQHSTVGVEIELSSSDAGSGLGQILYSLDGSPPTRLYNRPLKAYTSGTLRTRAVDRVGNAGPIATRTLDIDVSGDQTPPGMPLLRFTPLHGTTERDGIVYFTPSSPQSFLLVATAEDSESGIAAIAYPELPGWTRSSPPSGGVIYERGPSSDESGPHAVLATNHAGGTSERTFSVEREPAARP
jgi:hypothetical protein